LGGLRPCWAPTERPPARAVAQCAYGQQNWWGASSAPSGKNGVLSSASHDPPRASDGVDGWQAREIPGGQALYVCLDCAGAVQRPFRLLQGSHVCQVPAGRPGRQRPSPVRCSVRGSTQEMPGSPYCAIDMPDAFLLACASMRHKAVAGSSSCCAAQVWRHRVPGPGLMITDWPKTIRP
jgi:hypothetical protein